MWMVDLRLQPLYKQAGASLLIFTLIVIVGFSYLAIRNFKRYPLQIESSRQAIYKLNLAKQALLGYAVTYPDNVNPGEGPGYLPCPDTNGNGSAGGNCRDGKVGRFPWKTLELIDVYDASGQTLWYALSGNYRYGPNKRIPLNSETKGTLSVNGVGDIVAIIFAPGIPVKGQNRNANSNLVSHYLEDENNDGDTVFVTTLPSPYVQRIDGVYDTDENLIFNDQLVYITRQELMRTVERRVLGEFSQILISYFNNYGAYPWLSNFADPKSLNRQVSGKADIGSTSTLLVDSGQDFIDLNVRQNDIVYNITDGSFGIVASDPISSHRIAVSDLSQGDEDDFDVDDKYVVLVKNRADTTNATIYGIVSSSDAQVLEDRGKSFGNLKIAPGDIVDNLTDGSSGIIDKISGDEITVLSLQGGTDNHFDAGDIYIIRTNYGKASAGNSISLTDDNKDFVTMGVQAGNLVWNMSDGSMGRVATVAVNSLTFDKLLFGSDNDFDNGDNYLVVRHEASANTREGLLAFHEVGMPFQTGFKLEWQLTPGALDYDLTNANGLQQNYMDNFLASGKRSFDGSVGVCIWSVIDMVDCYGYFRDYLIIDGIVTSQTSDPNDRDTIYDSAASFITDHAKRGDIVQNYNDNSTIMSGTAYAGTADTIIYDPANNFSNLIPYSYLIHNTTKGTRGLIADILNANTIAVEPYAGSVATAITFNAGDNYTIYQPENGVVAIDPTSETKILTARYTSYDPNFSVDEYYRIIPAARSFTGIATGYSENSEADYLQDAAVDFIAMGVEIGDIIRINGAWGEITSVTKNIIGTVLYGYHEPVVGGDSYTVYFDYIHSRVHIIRPRFRGNQVTVNMSEVRGRNVCYGYDASCTTASAVSFTGNGTTPLLTIIDYAADRFTAVGTATFTPTGNSTGNLKVSNIIHSLAENSLDFPAWLIKNDWHKLVYIAYSRDDAPGSNSVCITGTNCLTLDGASLPANDKRALLIAAGRAAKTLRGENCNVLSSSIMQDRTTGMINNYMELENCDAGDDTFTLSATADDFNDQVLIMSP